MQPKPPIKRTNPQRPGTQKSEAKRNVVRMHVTSHCTSGGRIEMLLAALAAPDEGVVRSSRVGAFPTLASFLANWICTFCCPDMSDKALSGTNQRVPKIRFE